MREHDPLDFRGIKRLNESSELETRKNRYFRGEAAWLDDADAAGRRRDSIQIDFRATGAGFASFSGFLAESARAFPAFVEDQPVKVVRVYNDNLVTRNFQSDPPLAHAPPIQRFD